MLIGQGRNRPDPQLDPQAADVLRLHDGGCRWALLEPEKGVYDFAKLDQYLEQSEARGIPSLYVFSSTPAWAAIPVPGAPPGIVDPTSNCPPHLQDFTDFVYRLIHHAGGRIKYWEIWNEWNYDGFWCGTLDQLLEMAKVVYQAVGAKVPDGRVLMPSSCYVWDDNNILTGTHALLEAGFARYAHIVAIHGYLPDGEPAFGIVPWLEGLRRELSAHHRHYPIWDTEFGFKDPNLIADEDKANWVRDSMVARLGRVEAAIWYQWDNQTHGACCDLDGALTIAGEAMVDIHNDLHGAAQRQDVSA